MYEYIERMKRERDTLCERIMLLEKAIIRFELSYPKRVALMKSQLKSMKDYLFYLEERIHFEHTISKNVREV